MGRYKHRGNKASHKKKHDQKFREKEYQYQRDVVKGNVDDESYAFAELGKVSADLETDNITEKILKSGPPGFLSTTKHIIGSMLLDSGIDSVPIEIIDTKETNQEDASVKEQSSDSDIIEDTSHSEEDSQSTEQSKEFTISDKGAKRDMFISQRVKRGMVFWYNIDSDVNKNDSPTIEVDGKKYIDSLEYGNRPWLVVSSDEVNKKNRICTVVPLSSSQSNYNDTSHNKVHIYFCGRDTTILCEQMRTVNSIELREYASTLTDEVMDLVDKGIMYAMGIKSEITLDSINMSDAMNKIDSVISGVIQSRLSSELENLNKGRQEAIDDMILKISDGFESLYQSAIDGVRDDMRKRDLSKRTSDSVELEVSQEPVTQEELTKSQEDLIKSISTDKPFTSYSTRVAKFYERYPDIAGNKNEVNGEKAVEGNSEAPKAISRKTHMFDNVVFTESYQVITPPKKEGKMRKWTEELLAQFAYDFKYLPYTDIMARWDIGDEKKVIDIARKVERKLFTGDMNGKADFSKIKITYPGKVISHV